MKKLLLTALLLCSCEAKISINSEPKYPLGTKVLILSTGIPGIIAERMIDNKYFIKSSDLLGKEQSLICEEFQLKKITDEEFDNFFKERNKKPQKI